EPTHRILHPLRIDSEAPIQTIHRQITNGLQEEEFESVALSSDDQDSCGADSITTVPINHEWSTYRKGVQLLHLYSSNPDLVHTGASGIKSHPLLIFMASVCGAKHIHTHHTVTPSNYGKQRWLAEHADAVTAVSQFVANWARDEFDISNVEVIPNGVNLERFHPDVAQRESERILYVGRFADRKHPEIVIELAKRNSEFNFIIRGNGPLQENLKQKAPSNVTFLDRLSEKELSRQFAQAAIVLW
ncbi:MAG: glycosyltransferase family 4 protein, partial [Halobacteriaceae archaeon]